MGSSEKMMDKLVDACRILADDGQGDLIWGHVSVRRENRTDLIFMKPAGFGLEEIEREHVIEVNLNGEKIAGSHPLHLEVFIHTETLRARPELQAVVHTHPPHAVAFGSLCRPLLAVGHEGSLFCDGLPVFDETSDLIVSAQQGRAVARCLGESKALMLRNHGIVTAGRSLEEAVMTAIMLEKACRVQLLAEAAGGPIAVSSPGDAVAKRDRLYRPQSLEQAFRYCVRRAGARLAHRCDTASARAAAK